MFIVVVAAVVLLALFHQPLWMLVLVAVAGTLLWVGWNCLKIKAVQKLENRNANQAQ